jgi:hypothetical protein
MRQAAANLYWADGKNRGGMEMKTGGLTGRLVAAGRALTGIGQNELASASGIPLEKLRLLEASAAAWLPDEESQALDRALEDYGAVIVPEGDGLGAGVRLKFTRQDTRQIGRLETEGGDHALGRRALSAKSYSSFAAVHIFSHAVDLS